MSKAVNKRDIEQEAALHRVVVECYQTIFRPAREEEYEPRKNTVLHSLWMGKRLTLRHQRAWRHFVIDLHEAHGKSGPVSASYGEYADKPFGSGKMPTAYVNAQYKRLERLISEMTGEERVLLKDLIFEEIQAPGHLKLELIGFARSGYKDASQARAAGAATVTCLLSRIASFYSI